MNQDNSYTKAIAGIIKDFIIIIFVFASLCLIDLSLATFIGTIAFSILLIRRIILYYNPGFIKGYHIFYHNKRLTVAKEVDVFDLSKVSSIQYLYNYAEVIRGILIPPRIFIIRFCGIIVILSDIEENVMDQFGWYKIENEVGIGNIFFNINDALMQANKTLIRVKMTIL